MLLKIFLLVFLLTSTNGYKHRPESRKTKTRSIESQNQTVSMNENAGSGESFLREDHNDDNSGDTVTNAYPKSNNTPQTQPKTEKASTRAAGAAVGRGFKGAVTAVKNIARVSKNAKVPPKGKLDKFKLKAGEIDQAEFISGAAEGAIGGLMTMIEGIRSDSWQSIVTGSLDMISSVVGMMGAKGAAIGAVLSLISSLIGMFGGSTGNEETQEQMMERIVKTALEESRSEELKAEVNGAKEVFSTITDTINIFREKESMTYEQALSFYELSFQGVRIFGILEHYINSWCSVGNVNSDNRNVKEATTKRCLSVCNLYCDMAIYRQILLADMAGVIAQSGLNSTAVVFIELIEKEKKKDASILRFFERPFENKDRRFAIAQYYSKKYEFPTIAIYLKEILTPKYQLEGSIIPKKTPIALECTNWELQSSCRQIILGESDTYPKCVDLMFRVSSSVYIPHGFKLVIDFHRGIRDRYYGPSVYGIKVQQSVLKKSICFHKTNLTANDLVRICEGEKMSLQGKCASLDFRPYSGHELDNLKWEDKIKSLYVPKGILLTAYTQRSNTGEFNRYYGPATYMLVAKPNSYSSIKQEKTSKDTSQMIQLCTQTSLNGNCLFFEFEVNKRYNVAALTLLNSAITTVMSVKIPSNYTVTMFTSWNLKDIDYAQYVGPLTLPETEFGFSGILVSKTEL